MTKTPGDTSKDSTPAQSAGEPAKTPPVKPKTGPGLPVTKAERAARMRADKMVIKRMRKR
jgi:hypothetical protein